MPLELSVIPVGRIPISVNNSCGPHRIALLSEVFQELPLVPRVDNRVAGEVAGGQSTKYTARIAAASDASPDATVASCDPTLCHPLAAPKLGAISSFGKNPISP